MAGEGTQGMEEGINQVMGKNEILEIKQFFTVACV